MGSPSTSGQFRTPGVPVGFDSAQPTGTPGVPREASGPACAMQSDRPFPSTPLSQREHRASLAGLRVLPVRCTQTGPFLSIALTARFRERAGQLGGIQNGRYGRLNPGWHGLDLGVRVTEAGGCRDHSTPGCHPGPGDGPMGRPPFEAIQVVHFHPTRGQKPRSRNHGQLWVYIAY